MKHLHKMLLVLFLWGVVETGNSFAQIPKDMVVVTLRIPIKAQLEPESQTPGATEQEEHNTLTMKEQQPVTEKQSEPATADEPNGTPAVLSAKPYHFAMRTNILYDAMLLPTLGVEWRANSDLGVKLDGSLTHWGGNRGKEQKAWLLNPEVRWYLLNSKRFYVGVSGNYGEYNIYKYPIGSIFPKDTGYQGTLWSAGVTAGYQLYLSGNFSIDFSLGVGYTRFDYDSFGMTNGVRVYKERNQTTNFWGPTQAGISLVWTIGSNK